MVKCANELQQTIAQAQADAAKVYTRAKTRTPEEKRQSGEHYIDAKLDLVGMMISCLDLEQSMD